MNDTLYFGEDLSAEYACKILPRNVQSLKNKFQNTSVGGRGCKIFSTHTVQLVMKYFQLLQRFI